MKRIILLGATGSVGKQTIEVIESYPESFELVAAAVNTSIDSLFDLIETHKLAHVCVYDAQQAKELQRRLTAVSNMWTKVTTGMEGLVNLAVLADADMVVNALVGSIGILPTIAALEQNHDVALANKETLVAAGDIVMQVAQKSTGKLIPVDSEHSAIFQCLEPNAAKEMKQIVITASGGSLRDLSLEELDGVTREQVLAHPNWSMGAKITVDSATMMNKGFEVIEAKHLFNVSYDKIHTILHKESKIHSMVEYVDGSILAHLGVSDMRIPIQYALTYPERKALMPSTEFDWTEAFALNFEPLSMERFPALQLAYDCGRKGGTMPTTLNAANEIAVYAFLEGTLAFAKITEVLAYVVEHAEWIETPSLEEILQQDRKARKLAEIYISTL